MAKNKKNSWLDYLDTLQQKTFLPEQLEVKEVEQMLNINHHFEAVFHHSIPMIYLVDYTSGKYLVISKSTKLIMGYNPDNFIQGGIDFTINNYHKDDLRLFNEEIFPDRIQLIKQVPVHEQPNYIFSYNYRLKNDKGEYINLLQRNCFIRSDEKGNPLMSMGMVININNYKSENPVIQTVDKFNSDGLIVAETILKKSYYLHQEDKLFTKREKEILLWIAEGLISKEIADKLFISENTVVNHRRNMQTKSNTRNSSELVSYSLRQGII